MDLGLAGLLRERSDIIDNVTETKLQRANMFLEVWRLESIFSEDKDI